MAGSQMIKTNQRTPIGELSFIMGIAAILLATTGTILPRMAMTEENNVKTSWGLFRKTEGSTSSTSEAIQCSDLGDASRSCVACQAFSIMSIAAGAFGMAASIQLHEIFAGFTKPQTTLLILGAGITSLLVFVVFETGVINGGEKEDNPLRGAPQKESFVLFVLSWILFTLSAGAFYKSEEVQPVGTR
eukprot:m.113459 g.113459  ORF g.113459 m.113459 type:complete len:188 (-) comp21463_c0_seq1:222-785(-)